MKRLVIWCVLLCLIGGLTMSDTLTERTGVNAKTQASLTGNTSSNTCIPGQLATVQGSGASYRCVSGTWRRQDLARCSPDPPSGACDYDDACLSPAGNTIYFCDTSVWRAVGTSASSLCIDHDADGTCEVNANSSTTVTMDVNDDGIADYTFVPDTCVTGDVVTQGASGLSCASASATADINGDGTVDATLSTHATWQEMYLDFDGATATDYLLGGASASLKTVSPLGGIGAGTSTDADPESTSSAMTLMRLDPNPGGGTAGQNAIVGTGAAYGAFDSTFQLYTPTKLVYFGARIRGQKQGLAGNRTLVGGVRSSSNFKDSESGIRTKTDGIFFWCSPADDVDNSGLCGDINGGICGGTPTGDGDCLDGSEDPNDCKWYAVTMAGNVESDGAGKGTLAAGSNVKVQNTGINCNSDNGTNKASVWQKLEIFYNPGTTAVTFKIDGATVATATGSTDKVPTAANKLAFWGIVAANKDNAVYAVDVDWLDVVWKR